MKLARSSFKQPGVKGSGCYQHMVDEWPPLRVVDDYLDRRAKRPSEHLLRRDYGAIHLSVSCKAPGFVDG